MKWPISNDYTSIYTDFRGGILQNTMLKFEMGWRVSWNHAFSFLGGECISVYMDL